MGSIHIFGLELVEWAFLAGAVLFGLEVAGLSRSGRTARRQNADLRERNALLETELTELKHQIGVCRQEIERLKSRSVDALYTAFTEHTAEDKATFTEMSQTLIRLGVEMSAHEQRAAERHTKTLVLLESMTTRLEQMNVKEAQR